MLISFLFLDENICCGYSLEVPRRGASNEYPQHMLSSRNKKKICGYPLLSVAMSSECHAKTDQTAWMHVDLSLPWAHIQSSRKCCVFAHFLMGIIFSQRFKTDQINLKDFFVIYKGRKLLQTGSCLHRGLQD